MTSRNLSAVTASLLLCALLDPVVAVAQDIELRIGRDGPRYYDDGDYRDHRPRYYREDDRCTVQDAMRVASRRYGLRNVRFGRTGSEGTEILGIGRRGERVRMWLSTAPGCSRID